MGDPSRAGFPFPGNYWSELQPKMQPWALTIILAKAQIAVRRWPAAALRLNAQA
jgi:hypothetical protein